MDKVRRNRRKLRREFLAAYKLERGCAVCGYNEHHAALDFDHTQPELKTKNFQHFLHDGRLEKVIFELSTCQVLCANHHRIKTYNNKDWENNQNK